MSPLRIHAVVHVPEEGIGCIADWIDRGGHTLTTTFTYDRPSFPGAENIDMLIVMGGPMSVNDEEMFPWLVPEKRLVREAITRGKIVLGICLGSQMIANVLGARVYPNMQKEIGWYPIHRVSDRLPMLPRDATVFHWHGETFDLPAGAEHLAESEVCRNQAFIVGRTVLGLQFHFEVTRALVERMVASGESELIPTATVQTADAIKRGADDTKANNAIMHRVLDYLTAGLSQR